MPFLATSSSKCISLPKFLLTAIRSLCKTLIRVLSGVSGLVVADTGATNHMLPDALAFISYKRVTDLSIRMGNNSFVPVLGWGTAVFSLNRKHVLIWNVLQVPSFAVPLYSLRAHLHQPGCGFLFTFKDGFHVYFPSFVCLVDMPSVCHLTYKPSEIKQLSAPFIMFNHDARPSFILRKPQRHPQHILHTWQSLKMRTWFWSLVSLMATILLS